MSLLFGDEIQTNAVFSPCRKYRYFLSREWEPDTSHVMFCMLNPSTADEVQNDPTVTRCINYAKRWGYGGLVVTNAFALRSTDPKGLKKVDDPVGPENDDWIQRESERAEITIVAWGTHAKLNSRGEQVAKMLPDAMCLGVTQGGFPKHPLYLKADLEPFLYRDWKSNPEGA